LFSCGSQPSEAFGLGQLGHFFGVQAFLDRHLTKLGQLSSFLTDLTFDLSFQFAIGGFDRRWSLINEFELFICKSIDTMMFHHVFNDVFT
jgi:hypothetical protein